VAELLAPDKEVAVLNKAALITLGEDVVSAVVGKLQGRKRKARDWDKVEGATLPRLWASEMGEECTRKMCFKFVWDGPVERMLPYVYNKFLIGEVLEATTVAFLKHTRHSVKGEQERVEHKADGVSLSGRLDMIVDHILYDVKTMTPFGYRDLIKSGKVGWGYEWQVGYYYHKLKVKYELEHCGLWAINKVSGQQAAVLVIPPMWSSILIRAQDHTKAIITARNAPGMSGIPTRESMPVANQPVADGKSGNMKLPTKCSYCEYKWACNTGLRMFKYSNGPVYLTKVKKLPAVPEVPEVEALGG
jgi:hypothetical protein